MKTTIPHTRARTAYSLLSAIQRLIQAEPKRYDQTCFINRRDANNTIWGHRFPRCNTVGCVAGWVVTLAGPADTSYCNIDAVAERILGLDHRIAAELFSPLAVRWTAQTKRHAKSGAAHIAAFKRKHRIALKEREILTRESYLKAMAP